MVSKFIIDKAMVIGYGQRRGGADWFQVSAKVLDEAAVAGTPVLFDMTNVTDLQSVFSPDDLRITSQELRYIRDHWEGWFDRIVTWYQNDEVVTVPPWQW